MSGHSKWSQIKHQKGAADARRGNLFSKLANNISLAARSGADPATNFALRLAIERAKAANMPKANIERAIARGSGSGGEKQLEAFHYEAYGPGGIAILIDIATENRNRAGSEVKSVLNKFGGRLASPGSVNYLFEQVGLIKVKTGSAKDDAELAIIDSGAKDYDQIDAGYLVYTEPRAVDLVRQKLAEGGFEIEEAHLSFEPKTTTTVKEGESERAIKLLEALEELDDVVGVYSNLG